MLTRKQLNEIKELQRICEENQNFELKLNYGMLESRNEEENDLFYYEDNKLVGFLGIYGFGNKVEICGMVHPEYRRKGIFTRLFSAAKVLMEPRNYNEILLNAPSDSNSAKGFLMQIDCSYSFSEYQMKWEDAQLIEHKDIVLRQYTNDDLETVTKLDVKCFGFSEEDARIYNSSMTNNDIKEFYIIETVGNTVGKVRVSHINEEAWIYAFAIFPEFQGKGIGRKVLAKLILKETQKGYPVFLEVEAKNAHALKLYESCGFKTYHSQDYYRLI